MNKRICLWKYLSENFMPGKNNLGGLGQILTPSLLLKSLLPSQINMGDVHFKGHKMKYLAYYHNGSSHKLMSTLPMLSSDRIKKNRLLSILQLTFSCLNLLA